MAIIEQKKKIILLSELEKHSFNLWYFYFWFGITGEKKGKK